MDNMKDRSGKENSSGFIDADQEMSADELVESLFREIAEMSNEEAVEEEEIPTEFVIPDLESMKEVPMEREIKEEDLLADIMLSDFEDIEKEPEVEVTVPEEPVIDEPVIEEPVIEEPVIEASVIEEPVIEGAETEETSEVVVPVIEEPEEAEEPAVGGTETEEAAEVVVPVIEEPEGAEEPATEEAETEEAAEVVVPVIEEPEKAEEVTEVVVPATEEPSEVKASEAEVAEEAEAPAAEEAFDEPDPEVTDVSAGVPGAVDAPTEELPVVPLAVPQVSAREQKKADKAQQKADKKRQKQEAAEAKEREKQEAKERKRQAKEEKKANKKKGVGKIILSILLLLILAAAVVYLALSNRYKTIFYDGTVINGADCTGLTVEEAETIVSRQMENYDLTLYFRDGKKEVITGDSIGFEYVSDGSVQEIMDSQIPVMWLSAYFNEYSYDATAASVFDAGKLSQELMVLKECNIAEMTAPQNAVLQFSDETKKFEIAPEVQGNTFDLSAFIEAVDSAIKTGAREVQVEELGLYKEPEITSDNADLIKQRDDLNDVVSACISYTLPTGETQVLDGSILINWLECDEAGNYSVNSEKWGECIANYVSDLAAKVNTADTKLAFNTHNGETVVLDNYLRGWLIDLEAEGAQLTEELANRSVVTREPVYAQRAYADDNNGIGGTYVEVDLSLQYLWAYENGTVILEAPIVSGMMVASRYTPEGIYPLNGKQAGRWLRGDQDEYGNYEYESWVDYWMPFNGGIGLHDASWRADFGGSIYVGGGSHGCVNMPSGSAAALFDWITTGTPVICYYSYGYTVSPDGTYGEE